MHTARYRVTMNSPRRRPSRRRRRRPHLRPVAASHGEGRRTFAGTATTVLAAALGFSLVLALGRLATWAMGSSDSFGPLALAAATTTIFAPMGALVAAVVAAWPYRLFRLSPAGRRLMLGAMAGSWGITLLVYLLQGAVAASTALILQTAVLVAARVAVIESAPPRHQSPLSGPKRSTVDRRR